MTYLESSEHRIQFDEYDVGALFKPAVEQSMLIVFGHGAGAGMLHSTLEQITDAFATVGIASLRYNFPYMEAGKSRVDAQAVSIKTVSAAYQFAKSNYDLPILLGGHSFGGRMASHAAVEHNLDIAGLIFCSFPLHNPAKPSLDRAAHMDQISSPMLFLSGSRDGMADRRLMNKLARQLNATLKWLDTADHGYKVLKRTRKRKDDVFHEMAVHAEKFIATLT
ncbi:MAG: alpha/beta fold hydrolase [Gammaproteobacteria bacterium]|nr:alpha/beta fold hydrolase [Gammaproteobacteria bacterium]